MSPLIRLLYIFICLLISSGELNANLLKDSVKIGLLIPDKISKSALNGAEMAIHKANLEGGLNGIPFELVVRYLEGPWGTGSKEAVSLIFDERVCAIMSSNDSRNAHLIEQVATKARVVFLSAWSSDPTLSQAFVPWFFNCVPNDYQQADALIRDVYVNRKIQKTIILTDGESESEKTRGNIEKKIKESGNRPPINITIGPDSDPTKITVQIDKADCQGLILIGRLKTFTKLINFLKQSKKSYPVFSTLFLGGDDLNSVDKQTFENINFIASFENTGRIKISFDKEYQQKYGTEAGMIASFAFDGMTAIVKAIKNGGTDRTGIQKALGKIQFEGVTGKVEFDEKGNRTGTPGLRKF